MSWRDKYKTDKKSKAQRFVAKAFSLSNHIEDILERKGMSKAQLAEALDKSPSEISKLLSGNHNLTLRSITAIEAALDEEILIVASEVRSEVEYKLVLLSTIQTTQHAQSSCVRPEFSELEGYNMQIIGRS